MSVLPKEIDYSQRLSALPQNTSCLSAVVAPSNGATFSNGGSEIIVFDLPARGYMVPGSLYLRYKMVVPNGATPDFLLGTPFATPFSRLETIVGSQTVESLQQYNQLYNMIVNTKLNLAQKAGMASGFGLLDTSTTIAFNNLNGRNIPATTGATISMAAPLGCLLSNCDHLLPLQMMPNVRIQLTTESFAKMFQVGTTTTGYTLSNMELCMDIIDFGGEVDNIVRSMTDENGNIYLKSQSYSSSAQTIGTLTSGQIEIVYNQRISSIKSVYALMSPPTLSKLYGSKDLTKGTGDYQFIIGSVPYPPRALSSINNRSGILMELLNANGPSHDITSNNCHITPAEWAYNVDTADSAQVPAKFIVGCNVERLSTNSNLLTGTSSMLSPISFRINFGSASNTEVITSTLICCYDVILEVNIANRQISVKQ